MKTFASFTMPEIEMKKQEFIKQFYDDILLWSLKFNKNTFTRMRITNLNKYSTEMVFQHKYFFVAFIFDRLISNVTQRNSSMILSNELLKFINKIIFFSLIFIMLQIYLFYSYFAVIRTSILLPSFCARLLVDWAHCCDSNS